MVVYLQRSPSIHTIEDGIILDWDYFCAQDNMWQETIENFDLQRPFFSVMMEDGRQVYICEG